MIAPRLVIVLSASLFGSALLAGCENSSTDDSSSRRTIPASLRASCPALPAARAADSGTGTAVPVYNSSPITLSTMIYDSTGNLVQSLSYTISSSSSDSLHYQSLWNMRDASGNRVSTGHYFVFTQAYSSSGALLDSSSVCIGVVNNKS